MIRNISFQQIPVSDQDRALAFYTSKLGFKLHTDAPYGENWRWIFLELEGARTRLQFSRSHEITFTDIPALCLECADVDAFCETLLSRDVTVIEGPADAPWKPGVRWAMLRDSEGDLILLESMKAG